MASPNDSYPSHYRVLSIEPTFDINAVIEGRRYADAIVKRRTFGGEGVHDVRPSIGNAVVAVTLKTDDQLRNYVKERTAQRQP